jgi:hypothetical protein
MYKDEKAPAFKKKKKHQTNKDPHYATYLYKMHPSLSIGSKRKKSRQTINAIATIP